MAAITTLATPTTSFDACETTLVGTTWQEYTLPPTLQAVTVKSVSAIYVAFSGMGTPADGGAVHATRRYSQAAGGAGPGGGERYPLGTTPGSRRPGSLFVASQVGTSTVVIAVEGV